MRSPLLAPVLAVLLHSAIAEAQSTSPADMPASTPANAPAPEQTPLTYAAKISRVIRVNIVFAETFDELRPPKTEVEVITGEGGLVTEVRLTKPSLMPSWDAAVQRAIWRTERIPPDTDGRVPRRLIIAFTPR